MTDGEFPPPWEERPFDRISLSDDDAHRVSCAFARRRDLRSLASDALFFSLVLEGRSPRIDEAARAAIRHYVDLTRLLIAALPARDEDLNLKLAALTPPDPLVAEHVNLRASVFLRPVDLPTQRINARAPLDERAELKARPLHRPTDLRRSRSARPCASPRHSALSTRSQKCPKMTLTTMDSHARRAHSAREQSARRSISTANTQSSNSTDRMGRSASKPRPPSPSRRSRTTSLRVGSTIASPGRRRDGCRRRGNGEDRSPARSALSAIVR
jgi:hypothetical protein